MCVGNICTAFISASARQLFLNENSIRIGMRHFTKCMFRHLPLSNSLPLISSSSSPSAILLVDYSSLLLNILYLISRRPGTVFHKTECTSNNCVFFLSISIVGHDCTAGHSSFRCILVQQCISVHE